MPKALAGLKPVLIIPLFPLYRRLTDVFCGCTALRYASERDDKLADQYVKQRRHITGAVIGAITGI